MERMKALPRVVLAGAFTAAGFLQGAGVVRAESVGIVDQGTACGDAINGIPPTNRVRYVDYFRKGERQLVHDVYDEGSSSDCGSTNLPELINPVVVESGETEGELVLGEPYNNGVVKDGGIARCPAGVESMVLRAVEKTEGIEVLPPASNLSGRGTGTVRLVVYIPRDILQGLYMQRYIPDCYPRVGDPFEGRPYTAIVEKR